MKETRMPAWLDDARWYYSEIGGESAQPVSVFRTDREGVDSESPGTLCSASGASVAQCRRGCSVLGCRAGKKWASFAPRGLCPRARCRDAPRCRTSSGRYRSVRSSASCIRFGAGSRRLVDVRAAILLVATPNRHHAGGPRLLGGLGPVGWIWMMWIEPGRDTFDLLAAVGSWPSTVVSHVTRVFIGGRVGASRPEQDPICRERIPVSCSIATHAPMKITRAMGAIRWRRIALAPRYDIDPRHRTTSVTRRCAATGTESTTPVPIAT